MRKVRSRTARAIEALIFMAVGCALGWGVLYLPPTARGAWLGSLLACGAAGWILGERDSARKRAARVSACKSGLVSGSEMLAALDREMGLAARRSAPIALLAIEARNIEEINRVFDREEGDRAIQAVALAARGSLRETDVLARVSGLVFCAALPDSTAEAAAAAVKRAQDSIGAIRRSHAKGEVRVVCEVRAFAWDGTQSSSELLARIQKEMSEVKSKQ